MEWYRLRASGEASERVSGTPADIKADIDRGFFALVPATKPLRDAPDIINPSKNGLEEGKTYPVFLRRNGFFLCRKGDKVIAHPMRERDLKRAWAKEANRKSVIRGLP